MVTVAPPRQSTANLQERKAGLAYWAERVLAECDNASVAFAPDPVHDLRVAIRRCRSMADGFLAVDPDPVWKQMKRLGKPLFSKLGELRDTQVMAEWVTKLAEADDPLRATLLAELARREEQQKTAAQQALQEFDRKDWAALNAHLATLTSQIPLEGAVFQHLALQRWHDAHELHRQALRNRTQVGYHQLRIGIKRFRYTVENFLPERHERWSKDLRDLQDALGEVHDFDVLWSSVKEHPEIPPQERERWHGKITEEREKRLESYRHKMLGKSSLWYAWRAELPEGEALNEVVTESLRTWASYLDPDIRHSQHVARLALQIFDGLVQHEGLVDERIDRQILHGAALLHEVGRHKKDAGHAARSYRMICKLPPPFGWNEGDLRGTATVARLHRGNVIELDQDLFAGIPAERRTQVMRLAGILRLADALDSQHDQRISELQLSRRDEFLAIRATGFTDEMNAYTEHVSRARYLLEMSCRMPIVIEPSAKNPTPHKRVAAH